MKKEYERLKANKSRLEQELANLPAGKLILCSNGPNNTSWFVSDGHEKSI